MVAVCRTNLRGCTGPFPHFMVKYNEVNFHCFKTNKLRNVVISCCNVKCLDADCVSHGSSHSSCTRLGQEHRHAVLLHHYRSEEMRDAAAWEKISTPLCFLLLLGFCSHYGRGKKSTQIH